jgi:nucleoside-diphosphate-sugar epimerase
MIVLIGAKGFVGSAFARWCEANGREFLGVDVDNYQDCIGTECDLLVNANGNSRKPLANQDPLLEFQMSVESVLKTTVDFKFKKYLHLSTCDVYAHTETPEGNREADHPEPSKMSRYGFHKYLAEQYVRYSASDWVIFRLGGMVGPNLRKNAVYDVLHGGPVWLDPASELQFMHTDEVASVALELAETVSGEVVNLCGKGVVSVRQMMEWAGGEVPVSPNSPKVRYEINTERVNGYREITRSAETVKRFIEGNRK